MKIVLDTNVLVSALLSPFGPPARVLDLILVGDLIPVFDDRILAEYRQVLARERFGFDPGDVADLLCISKPRGSTSLPSLSPSRCPTPTICPFWRWHLPRGLTPSSQATCAIILLISARGPRFFRPPSSLTIGTAGRGLEF